MNRRELQASLERAGVPAQMYELQGVHEPRGHPQDFYFIRREDGEWGAGIYERGQYKVIKRFADENEACRYLYGKLAAKLPEAIALATDEAQQILDDSEENQRRAWESFERARPTRRAEMESP